MTSSHRAQTAGPQRDPTRAPGPIHPSRRVVLCSAVVVAADLWLGSGVLPSPAEDRAAELLDAARAGDFERVRGLLAEDPSLVDARDHRGLSAYAAALLGGHRAVAELLRERGHRADLHEAALALDWERFEELAAEEPAAVDAGHPVGGNAMVAAALGGAGSDLWRVMRQGGSSNVAMEDGLGFTAVRAALELPDLATAEITAATLLGNGGDPNAPQRDGSSPLHAAARRGSRDLVEMLVRLGARVDARDDNRRTPRDLAELAGHEEVSDMLASHEEIPRTHSTSRLAWDFEGRPYRQPDLSRLPLALRERAVGVCHFSLEEITAMVERHPELARARATSTEVTVEACAHTGRPEIVDFLLERGAPYSLPTAVGRGDLRRAVELLDEDPRRINERGPHDFPLLWYPLIGAPGIGGARAVEATELLLQRGAQVERQHHLGTTALHWAAAQGERDVAALLLEAGADPVRVGRKFEAAGQTPLELAEARGREEMVTFLRQALARG